MEKHILILCICIKIYIDTTTITAALKNSKSHKKCTSKDPNKTWRNATTINNNTFIFVTNKQFLTPKHIPVSITTSIKIDVLILEQANRSYRREIDFKLLFK